MMKDEQILNNLFELARNERPLRSFEEVETAFRKDISLQTAFSSSQFLHHISLNHILLLLTSGIVLSYFLFSSLNSTTEIQKETQTPTNKISEPSFLDTTPVTLQTKENEYQTISDTTDSKLKSPSKNIAPKKESLEEKNLSNGDPADTIQLFEPEESPAVLPLKIDSTLSIKPVENRASPNLLDSSKTISLMLEREDNLGEVEYFNDALEKYGFTIKTRSKFSSGDEFLEEYFCHFKHPDGLNFKLFGSGFDQLEIKLSLNREAKVIHFNYRFNQESFTKDIPLKLRGNKSYFYGKGFSGKSGTTNINIEN